MSTSAVYFRPTEVMEGGLTTIRRCGRGRQCSRFEWTTAIILLITGGAFGGENGVNAPLRDRRCSPTFDLIDFEYDLALLSDYQLRELGVRAAPIRMVTMKRRSG